MFRTDTGMVQPRLTAGEPGRQPLEEESEEQKGYSLEPGEPGASAP
jgi:hypothetical protein